MHVGPAVRAAPAALAVALAVALVVAACSPSPPAGDPLGEAPLTGGDPTTAAPGAVTAPVRGERTVSVRSVSPDPVVISGGRDVPPDERLVQAFAAQVADWLDAHLTDLQAGGVGQLELVAGVGLLEGSSREAVAAVTSALASPAAPVAHARYDLLVATAGPPHWVRASAVVTHPDGSVAVAQFVFVPDDGRPSLVAAGPYTPAAP